MIAASTFVPVEIFGSLPERKYNSTDTFTVTRTVKECRTAFGYIL